MTVLQEPGRRSTLPFLSIAGGVLFWSTIEVVSKMCRSVTPAEITFFRFLAGGLVILPVGIVLARRASGGTFRVTRRFLFVCFALGFLGVVLAIWPFQLSLKYLSAASAASLFCGHPLWVALMAPPLLKERVPKRVYVGVLVGVLGIVALSVDAYEVSHNALTGIALVLVSGVFFAAYTVLMKFFNRRGASALVLAVSSIFGSLVMLGIVLAERQGPHLLRAGLDDIRPLLFLSLFSTGLGYVLYFWGLARVPTSSGTSLIYMKPAVATALAVLLLHERVQLLLVVGVALVIVGVGLAVGGATPKSVRSDTE